MRSPAESAQIDNKAMNEAAKYIEDNPGCSYRDVASSIAWYWSDEYHDTWSPWICDFIVNKLEKRDDET